MGKDGKISQYRERLDMTLASPDLTNCDALKTLVGNQLIRSSHNDVKGCSENVIIKRTGEVSNFLDMLRSASVSENAVRKNTETSHGEWKLKDDNEEYRVMYRQGPQGTPFHTLLVEGYVDGTVDACLCISWECNLYKKWWPQYNFPPFKITMCKCLQKVRIGEQISLVRVKITWPLSSREAVVHYFAFEYLQDGLVVVLINTISDLERIDRDTNGFTRDGIPEPKDVVRIDVVGGFALQMVTSERSYFRTIMNMDLKLDFVPPSLINFISRQLVGNGFRLYQKAVASLSNHDDDYGKALNDPMYARIREALYSIDGPNKTMDEKNLTSEICVEQQEHSTEYMQKNLEKMEQNACENDDANEFFSENEINTNKKSFDEIEEEKNDEMRQLKNEILGIEEKFHRNEFASEILKIHAQFTDTKHFGDIDEVGNEDSGHVEKGAEGIDQPSNDQIANKSYVGSEKNIHISPAVEQALGILERAISVAQEYKYNAPSRSSPGLANEETTNLQKGSEKVSTLLEDDGVCRSNAEVSTDEFREENTTEKTSHESRNSSSNADIRHVKSNSQVSHNRITPDSPEQCLPNHTESNYFSASSLENRISSIPIMDHDTKQIKQMSNEVSIIPENNGGSETSKPKRHRSCCFGLTSR